VRKDYPPGEVTVVSVPAYLKLVHAQLGKANSPVPRASQPYPEGRCCTDK